MRAMFRANRCACCDQLRLRTARTLWPHHTRAERYSRRAISFDIQKPKFGSIGNQGHLPAHGRYNCRKSSTEPLVDGVPSVSKSWWPRSMKHKYSGFKPSAVTTRPEIEKDRLEEFIIGLKQTLTLRICSPTNVGIFSAIGCRGSRTTRTAVSKRTGRRPIQGF